jgi:hypothetical protein
MVVMRRVHEERGKIGHRVRGKVRRSGGKDMRERIVN